MDSRPAGWLRIAITFALISSLPTLSLAQNGPAKKTTTGTSTAKVQPNDVIAHLEQTIAWYHHVWDAEQLTGVPTDLVVRDATLQRSLQALQLAFDFAHAEADFLAQEKRTASEIASAADAGATGQNLTRAVVTAAQRTADVQAKLADVQEQLAGRINEQQRELLGAKQRELNAELALAKQVQNTIQGMLNVIGEGNHGNGAASGLLAQIETLERSVPEARHPPKKAGGDTAAAPAAKPAGSTATPPAAASFHPESSGLIVLATEFVTLRRGGTELKLLLDETDQLLREMDRLKAPVVATLRATLDRSRALIDNSDGQDVAQIRSDQQEIEKLTTMFKELSTAIVPLGEQQIVIETTRTNLAGWRNSIQTDASQAAKYLFIRTAMIGFAILIVLGISSAWKRITNRYISDPRRRRQFVVIRRIVVTLAVSAVIALGFVTDFGSIATYAGFLTAGIALGLQNVILSVVAYFLLIGKYGIKAGDRVTISGVTGDVIDIGLVRMYLMELAGDGENMHPTGRTAVYANSIIFQPSAFFKQVPGAEYIWHGVSMTLKSAGDPDQVKSKLTEVVNIVFRDYCREIALQHSAFERSVEIKVKPAAPVCKVISVGGNIEFQGRYPIDPNRATEMDTRMVEALRQAAQDDAQWELVQPPRTI